MIYVYTGLGLSTGCLPIHFVGGPLAILLCYTGVFLLLLIHLPLSPDRDDGAVPAAYTAGRLAGGLHAPILAASTVQAGSDGLASGADAEGYQRSQRPGDGGGVGPDSLLATSRGSGLLLPAIGWRWERWLQICSLISAAVTTGR